MTAARSERACSGCKAGGGHFSDCASFRGAQRGDFARPAAHRIAPAALSGEAQTEGTGHVL